MGASCPEAAVQGTVPGVYWLVFLAGGHRSRATVSPEPPGAAWLNSESVGAERDDEQRVGCPHLETPSILSGHRPDSHHMLPCPWRSHDSHLRDVRSY